MKLIHVTRKRLYGTIMFLVIPLFAACGGGGNGDGPTTPPPPATAMGAFIDSPVQGLGYQSGTATPGTTDANGTFDYTVGETLSFSVGGVVLGTLPDGAPVITPFDFAGATENIARFLQTLDADRDHINGIDLVAAATALADTVQDASIFASDAMTFETDIAPIIETALGLLFGCLSAWSLASGKLRFKRRLIGSLLIALMLWVGALVAHHLRALLSRRELHVVHGAPPFHHSGAARSKDGENMPGLAELPQGRAMSVANRLLGSCRDGR